MEKNLIEAAAELLGKSKNGAVPAMPMPDFKQSYDEYTKLKDINTNEMDDLGGDIPTKRETGALNYTKGAYANAPTPANPPGAKPAVGQMPMPDMMLHILNMILAMTMKLKPMMFNTLAEIMMIQEE